MSATYKITTIDTQTDEEHYHEIEYPDPMPDPSQKRTATFGRAWDEGELEIMEGWEIVVTDPTGSQVSGWVNSIDYDHNDCINSFTIDINRATDNATSESYLP